MCFYLKLFAATIKVLNWITADSNATIQLRSGNFTSNFTINYKPCSGDPSKIQFRPPVVHLVNLTADVMYCYSIASNENSDATQVAGSCNGTFYTTADTTTETPPTTGTNLCYFVSQLHDKHEVQRSVYLLHTQHRKTVTKKNYTLFELAAAPVPSEWLTEIVKCLLVLSLP